MATSQLEKLETVLDESLNKKAPKLPDSSRKTLAGALWWLALVGGVGQLYLAWSLWDNWHKVDEFLNYGNALAEAYGLPSSSYDLGFEFYLALITLVVSGALLLLASPALKAMKKSGWNLIFYSLLINLVYGLFVVFTSYGDFSNLLGAAVGSLLGAYLLFQVREHFMKSPAHHHAA